MESIEAIKKLGIEEYSERIFNSNSHGELVHLYDYIMIAESFDDVSWFKDWFEDIVKFAEKNWKRPEAIFQHIPKMLASSKHQYNVSQPRDGKL